jgi:lysophospholipase L1-like esterase
MLIGRLGRPVALVIRILLASITAIASVAALAGPPAANWTATWATANKVEFQPFDAARPAPRTNDSTLRQIVRISQGGAQFRVWLTNELGTAPLNVGAASLALRDEDSAIVGTAQPLTFGGQESVTIAAGQRVASDPVSLDAPDFAELAISLYLPDDLSLSASPITYHPRALQTSYQLDGVGDQVGASELNDPTEIYVWAYLAAVDVTSQRTLPVVATFGDSLTDGDQLAADEPIDRNERYPDFLAERFLQRDNPGKGKRLGQVAAVVNLGISGNQVLSPLLGDAAQTRFGRDVTSLSGVSHVVIWEGINDIGLPPLFGAPYVTADALQQGLSDLASQARAAGLTVVACTLTPAGAFALPTYGSAEAEAVRNAVNDWIRTTDVFDRVVDLDALLRDPETPEYLRTDLTVDGLHLNAKGYGMVADAVYAALLRGNGRHPL